MEGGLIGFGNARFSSEITLKSKKRVNDDEWHHVVATRQYYGKIIKIYIDGALDA
jgi:hypothetical protein